MLTSFVSLFLNPGSQVLRVLVRNQNFNQRTTHWSSSLMRQHNFLKNLLTDLESEKSQQVLEDLAKLKRAIAHDHDLILHVAGDLLCAVITFCHSSVFVS